MNQDQVKAMLLDIKDDVPEFKVIFSGKISRKVNGLYKPESMEIILHNKNFNNENELIYTAIHEFAHHVQFSMDDSPIKKYRRAHNSEFYFIFYQLLEKAEELGYYKPGFEDIPELKEVTNIILTKYIEPSGELMKGLGELLIKAQNICKKNGLRFEDYLDRIINFPKRVAELSMKAKAFELDNKLGIEKMKIVAGISDPIKRESVAQKLLKKVPIEKIKHQMKTRNLDDPVEKLEKEKIRIEKSIERLTAYLKQIEEELQKVKKSQT